MSSINHPWAISDKFKKRYGKIWSEMDFEVAKISNHYFRSDPMNTIVGTLHICGQKISLKYKHLLFKKKINVRFFYSFSLSWNN